jgi:prevent-host-death family protein
MQTLNVRDAREQLASLLDSVEAGEEIMILRRGKPAAKLVKPQELNVSFPDRTAFRKSLSSPSETSSEAIRRLRDEERF